MATSPTTSALGAVGDLGRPAAAKVPPRADNNAEKSNFSAVFQDAQGSRHEPQQRSTTAKTATPQTSRDDEKAHLARGRNAAPSGNKASATAAPTGKDLPPDGESLPATLDQLLTEMSSEKEASASRAEDDNADSTADCAPAISIATPGIAVVVPENPVSAAAAALASRSGQVAGDDGQPSAAVGDVTSTQKREIPAAAQTLNATAALSGESNSAESSPADAAAAAVLIAPAAKTAVAKLAGDKKTVETPAAIDPSATPVATGVTTGTTAATLLPNAVSTDAGIAPEDVGRSVTLEKMSAEKTPGLKPAGDLSGGDKSSTVLTAEGGSGLDGAVAGISDTPVEPERGSFRDTLKQLDSTLTSSTARSDTTPVSATRDSGLRQYIDSAATGTKVDVPVGNAGWSDAVAGKVMWMSSQNLSSAEIQMNPADLGPLSVRVSSHQDQTSIYFTSPHASVREALDQSLPRLREMMGNQGIQLQDVGVGGQGSMREQHASSDSGSGGGSRGRGARDAEIDAEIGSVTRATTTVSRPGLLDAYA